MKSRAGIPSTRDIVIGKIIEVIYLYWVILSFTLN
jgi:exosome complex RNA-binding protein Rrp4